MNNIKYNCEEQLEMVSRNYSRLGEDYTVLQDKYRDLVSKYEEIRHAYFSVIREYAEKRLDEDLQGFVHD